VLRQWIARGVGGLRLIGAWGGRMEAAAEIVDRQLQRLAWLSSGRNRRFYAVGGTWRAIARLHMQQADYPLRVMHGYTMPTEDAIAFCESFRKPKRLSALRGFEQVARPRREVLPYGALVLERF